MTTCITHNRCTRLIDGASHTRHNNNRNNIGTGHDANFVLAKLALQNNHHHWTRLIRWTATPSKYKKVYFRSEKKLVDGAFHSPGSDQTEKKTIVKPFNSGVQRRSSRGKSISLSLSRYNSLLICTTAESESRPLPVKCCILVPTRRLQVAQMQIRSLYARTNIPYHSEPLFLDQRYSHPDWLVS